MLSTEDYTIAFWGQLAPLCSKKNELPICVIINVNYINDYMKLLNLLNEIVKSSYSADGNK